MSPLIDQYKRLAAECQRIAEETSNEKDKARLLQMAEAWRKLAENAEKQEPGNS